MCIRDSLYAAGYAKPKWWFGFDWDTGQTKYEIKDFTTGAAIYADGRLYILDEQGNVGLIRPAADRLEIVGRFSLTSERVRDAWAHPVLLDGRLYLRYHDTVSYTHLRAHETVLDLVCRLLLEKKKKKSMKK